MTPGELRKHGLRHEPFEPVPGNLAIHRTHPSKPVWWERVKGDDGKWTATPHYGTPVESRQS